jgi:hypothetical protein
MVPLDPPDADDQDPRGLRVRPYALTGGRTRPSTDLPLEALVTATSETAATHRLSPEKQRILSLAQEPISVAEISARLPAPLGVARVLVGDLLTDGLLDLTAAAVPTARPDVALLERVLHGLHAL